MGLDSLAFLDDNPAERDQVGVAAPEVHVLDAVDLPAGFETAVREFPLFERLNLSTEDRKRNEYYQAGRERQSVRESSGSLEDYYRMLEQVVEIAPVAASTLDRVSQLTRKTNQFNMTTKRYSTPQVVEAANRPDTRVYAVKVSDRYGDNGIVGVCIVNDRDKFREIDTLLLSCRVIGRTVERAILSFLARSAAEAGFEELRGWFRPTAKNAPAADFYTQNGFRIVENDGENGALWALPLDGSAVACPDWIRLEAHDQEPALDLSYSR